MNKNDKLTFVGLELENHPLFDKKINFFINNEQNFYDDKHDKLFMLTGKNATGKTVILKLVMGTLSLLLEDKPISYTKLNDVLIGDSPIKINTFFRNDYELLYKDELTLEKSIDGEWIIDSEKIYQKKIVSYLVENSLFEFNDEQLIYDRKNIDEIAASVLAADKSLFKIVRKVNNYKTQKVIDTLAFTDLDTLLHLYNGQDIPKEILEYLDSAIDYLKIEVNVNTGKAAFYRLKFKHSDEEFTNVDFATIKKYLSLGTVNGIILYGYILHTLITGGIIFIDEFENHLDQEIVKTFVEYFIDDEINKNNATIIFSTRYPKLLNDFEYKHKIFYAIKRDNNVIQLHYFYNSENRFNGLVKNKIFDSASFDKTIQEYNVYFQLRKATERIVENSK